MRSIALGVLLAVAHATPSPAEEPPAVARRLWHDLVCLCPECDRLRLDECRCEIARREREAIVDRVRQSAAEKEEDVYRNVVESYVARSGKRVLASESVGGPDWPLLIVVLGVPTGGILAIVLFGSRRRKVHRRRARR